MYQLNFIDDMNKAIEPFKEWIMANHSNPFLWIGLFLVGLAIFGIAYNALHKN